MVKFLGLPVFLMQGGVVPTGPGRPGPGGAQTMDLRFGIRGPLTGTDYTPLFEDAANDLNPLYQRRRWFEFPVQQPSLFGSYTYADALRDGLYRRSGFTRSAFSLGNPPSGNANPPAGGQNPPSGNANPPAGGQNPPGAGQGYGGFQITQEDRSYLFRQVYDDVMRGGYTPELQQKFWAAAWGRYQLTDADMQDYYQQRAALQQKAQESAAQPAEKSNPWERFWEILMMSMMMRGMMGG